MKRGNLFWMGGLAVLMLAALVLVLSRGAPTKGPAPVAEAAAPPAAPAPSPAASPPIAGAIRLQSKPGSRMRIEGTSNIHDWQVESHLIGGYLEVGSDFPLEPGQPAQPGKTPARAEPFIMARSLKSVEKDGKPYSDKMDEIMHEKLLAKDDPRARILYFLNELTLKEAAKSKEAPYVFEAKGSLVVAGVTNQITLPVEILPLGEGKLRISGATGVRMTSFRIEPPAVKVLGIKTGDEVKLRFQWVVGPKPASL